jgi:streptogramin lyase
MTPAGVVTNFTGTGISGPAAIAVGYDGNLWFTNFDNDSIGRITPAGVVSNFVSAGAVIDGPLGITAGPQGFMWFTAFNNSRIGLITMTGQMVIHDPSIYGAASGPVDIVGGPDGKVYYTNSTDDSIGRINLNVDPPTYHRLAGTVDHPDDPRGITVGPDGALWFTNAGGAGSIGRITTASVVTTFPGTGGQFNGPADIVSGADGNLWFTNTGNNTIGRVSTAGVVDTFGHGTVSGPAGITVGPGSNLWFTNSTSDSIGRSTTAGVIDQINGNAVRRPYDITKGPDGNMWFTNSNSSSISRITPAGAVTSFTDPVMGRPYGITAGPDGNLWFTDHDGNEIGRITTAGVVTMYGHATIDHPHGIAAGPDGALWFTNSINNSIGRITTHGAVTNFTHATISSPQQITAGPDGNVWFTNRNNNSIGRITPAGAVTNYSSVPGTVAGPYGIATGADGNVYFTNRNNNSIGRINPTTFEIVAVSNVGMGNPADLAAGPDGNVWFTSFDSRSVGRVTPAWDITMFQGVGVKQPYGIGAGPDGAMWFTNLANNSIGRVVAANVPGAPTGVTGSPGNAQVVVSWSAPADNGGSAISGYTVTSSPGAKTCSTTGALSCTVTGLTNGTAYTFTVKATNGVGVGSASGASAAVTPVAGATVPGAPTAVVAVAGKQRAAVSWVAPVSSGGSVIVGYTVTSLPGSKTCSTTGALSCVVTGLTAGTSYTFRVRATNAVGQGSASVVSAAVVPWDGSGYHAVTPKRILDSRVGNGFSGPVTSAATRSLQVTGLGGPSNVPATATAVVMNVTVAEATNESFLTVFPTGTIKPNASNLNFGAGQVIPNLVTVKIGTGGKVELANAVGATQVIADVVGYYDNGAVAGDLFTGITPVRLLDSRGATGGWVGPLPAGAPRDLVVRKPGNGLGVPATATAVVANVTAVGGSDASFVSVWPSGEGQPNVSNLNLLPGQAIPNLVTVKIGTGGAIRIANAVGSVHVIVDVVGYFDPTGGSRFHALNPKRILDTRVAKGLSGPQGPGQTRALAVAGAVGTTVPAGATGLVANVTVAEATAQSFVAVFPGNVARPNPFSNLNFDINQVIPNLTTVGIAPNGSVNFYNHLGTTALIADAVGYYAPT